MGRKQKMGHQAPAAPQGKKTFLTLVFKCKVHLYLLSAVDFSRPPKKNFVEVTELTDITYVSNLVKLRPGHMNIVLVLTDASKNILLSKFAKEVYSFTG